LEYLQALSHRFDPGTKWST